jgi:hypothetical protein
MLQVTIQVAAADLAPTLDDIFKQMTTEDKSKMAAELALKYFTDSMNFRPDVDRYSYHPALSNAEKFLQQLASTIGAEVQKQLTADPTLNSKVEAVLDTVRPHLMVMVQNAVLSILSGMVKDSMGTLQQVHWDTAALTNQLKQLRVQ